jgi:hypothetical protein
MNLQQRQIDILKRTVAGINIRRAKHVTIHSLILLAKKVNVKVSPPPYHEIMGLSQVNLGQTLGLILRVSFVEDQGIEQNFAAANPPWQQCLIM